MPMMAMIITRRFLLHRRQGLRPSHGPLPPGVLHREKHLGLNYFNVCVRVHNKWMDAERVREWTRYNAGDCALFIIIVVLPRLRCAF